MGFQTRITFSSSNPTYTDLPLLFAARMMVIFLLWIRGMENILPPFLPFFEGLNYLRGHNLIFDLLDWVYWISLVMVFAGVRYKFFSLVLSALVFFSIISAKPQFSNSFLYSGCILFLIGMYKPGMEWIFRVQIALLYLGAGLNKLLDPDWLSGQYFDYFFTDPYQNSLYRNLSSLIPGKGLAIFFSYVTILTELGLGVWALLQRRKILLVLSINFFHISMLLITAGELSYIFFFLMAVSSYLLLPWEEIKGSELVYDQNSRFLSFLRNVDFDHFFQWKVFDEQFFAFDIKGNRLSLLLKSLLFNKFLYGFLVLFLVFLSRYKDHLLAIF
jgi:hypothetical protein